MCGQQRGLKGARQKEALRLLQKEKERLNSRNFFTKCIKYRIPAKAGIFIYGIVIANPE